MKKRIGIIIITGSFVESKDFNYFWDLIQSRGFQLLEKEKIFGPCGELKEVAVKGLWDYFEVTEDKEKIPIYNIIFARETDNNGNFRTIIQEVRRARKVCMD